MYHHWSYAEERWLDVVPLCDRCHSGVHTGRIADPTTHARAVEGPEIDPDDRGACPWPKPAPEPVEKRLRRLQVFREVAAELFGASPHALFAEAERRLRAERA